MMTYSTLGTSTHRKDSTLTLDGLMKDLERAMEKINTPSTDPLNGWSGDIIDSPHLQKRVLKKMCRSKKKRIRKKWLKNPKNYKTVPDSNIYIIDMNYLNLFPGGRPEKTIVAHPEIAAILRKG